MLNAVMQANILCFNSVDLELIARNVKHVSDRMVLEV